MFKPRLSAGANTPARFFSLMGRMLPVFLFAVLATGATGHAQVSCTGLCLQQVSCGGGGTTSISGTVYAPNGTDPLPNVLVYIPNAPVGAFPSGVQCQPNGQPALGSPLVSTTTATNGTFTLTNVPVGTNIPLVIQAGKWRRQFVIPLTHACANTDASAGQMIRLPKTQAEGDIPQIAVVTGAVDALECVMRKIGVADSEFTNASGTGRINFYYGNQDAGATIDAGTPAESTLVSSATALDKYDMVMLPCQGTPASISPAFLNNIANYADAGGRIFATHYSYDLLATPFATTAQWDVDQNFTGSNAQTAIVNQAIPEGAQLAQWLLLTGASTTLGQVPVASLRKDQDGVNPPTESFLSIASPSESIQFTFGTPVSAPPASQCGRVLFNEYHVEDIATKPSTNKLFPAECATGPLSPQEKLLEYSIFDLGTFVSASPSPTVAVSFTNTPATLLTGDTADTVAINVTNTSTTTATNRTLTLAVNVPAGLHIVSLAPAIPATSGWTCSATSMTCSRTTGLDAQASDAVILTFGVSAGATSPQDLVVTVANGNLAAPVIAADPVPVLIVPTITWPTPAAIAYGTPLSGTQLDATATYNSTPVPGSFMYSPAANTVLDAGLQTLSTTFTPKDPTTYASANQIVGLQVNGAPQVITFTPPLSPATAGNTVVLSATGGPSGNPIVYSVLSGNAVIGATPTGVTLTYTGAGNVVIAADQAASANGDYAAAAEVTATVSVNPAQAAYSAGTVPVGQQSNVLTATLNFVHGGALGSLNYLTQGAPNLDFIGNTSSGWNRVSNTPTNNPIPACSVGTVYAAGQICTVQYIFQPSHPGQRLGSVTAVDNTGLPMGTSYLTGLGTGPQLVFPGNKTTNALGSGFYQPYGVAVDALGNVYVADTFNGAVKEIVAVGGSIPANPNILTLVSGLTGPIGVAVDGAGNVFFSDADANVVKEIVAVGGSIPATPAILTLSNTFSNPHGVAVDGAGNVYVADYYNNAVKEIVAVGGSIPANPTILTLVQQPGAPTGVAVDGSGNVYVTYAQSGEVDEIVAVGGSIPANPTVRKLSSGFNYPAGVAVDGAGNVYVAAFNTPVQEIVAMGGTIPANPNVLPLSGQSFQAYGVAVDGSGNVYVADATRTSMVQLPLATPPVVTFADTSVGAASSSDPQKVTVANNGYDPTNTNPLTFSGVSTGTANFALDPATACSPTISLEPGVTCLLAADFMPKVPGTPLTDAVTLVDNSLNNPAATQVVPLSGNGLQQTPGVTVAPATVAYGTPIVALSAAVSFAGTAAPAGTVTFAVDGGLAVAASCVGITSPLACTANYPSNTLQVAATHTITASIAPSSGFLASSGTNTLTVTPATLTVNIIGSPTKVYDGTFAATLTAANYQVGGLAGADAITINQTAGSYATSTAGAAPIPVSAQLSTANFVATSGSLSNYILPSVASGTGFITPAPLTATAGSYTGVYDGSSHALSACVVSNNPDGLTCTNNPATVGPDVGGATVLPVLSGGASNYSVTTNNGAWSITPRAVTLTAGSYTGAYDGSAHAPSACASNYAGVACSDSPATVGPQAGSGSVNAVPSFSTGIAADYTLNSVAGSYSIAKLAASVTPNPASKVYGTADPMLTGTLSGFLPADGSTAIYTRTSGESVGGSPYTISATLVPTPALSNYTITYNTAAFTITKATPLLAWANPAGISYGTALSNAQLNATANPTGGTFVYTPGAGTVVGVGSQTLSVLYTPADTADYNTASTSVPLTVGQATPTVTWANPPSIVYGTGTGAAQKTATATGVGGVSLPGSYFYTTPDGTIFTVGTHPLGVAFTPTDTTDYVPVSAYAYLTVTKATPTVMWAAPAAITYGTALSGAQLNATASVPGSLSYSPAAGTVLHAGSQTLSVTFTPTDSTDYATVTSTVALTVKQVTPVITWATPAAISYGTPLSATQLNATANVAGTFSYTPAAGTLLSGGPQTLSVTFTPTDAVDYTTQTKSVTLQVNASTVTIGVPSGTYTYQTWINLVMGPSWSGNYATSHVPTGTVTLKDNGVALVTLPLGGDGKAYWTTNPPLNVGVHNLTVVYNGDANYPPGLSATSVITMNPAQVNFQATCDNGTIYNYAPWQCSVSLSASTTTTPAGVITYSLDGGSPVTVAISNGSAPFTVPGTLNAGTHSLVLNYAAQGNYAAAGPLTRTVNTAPGSSQLLISPSSYGFPSGSSLTITGTITTPNSGIPQGTVAIYDGSAMLGTANINAQGAFTYTAVKVSKGSHTYSAKYAGTANYSAVTSSSVTVTAY